MPDAFSMNSTLECTIAGSSPAAMRGDVKKGLFFRGVGALPFGSQIRSVRELIDRLLTPAALLPA